MGRRKVNMAEQNKQRCILAAVVGTVIVLAAVLIPVGCKKEPAAAPPDTEHQQRGQTPSEGRGEAPGEPTRSETPVRVPKKLSINDVIKYARTWGPVHKSWYGKEAPDFTLTDITGKKHKLSDYRGKDVMIVIWATWCRPCFMEIPHLITLQETIAKDKLAIWAVAYITPMCTTDMVKSVVRQNQKINYTVFSAYERELPRPFNTVEYIPASFFIDPDGKIKVATSGLLRLSDMKAILEAE